MRSSQDLPSGGVPSGLAAGPSGLGGNRTLPSVGGTVGLGSFAGASGTAASAVSSMLERPTRASPITVMDTRLPPYRNRQMAPGRASVVTDLPAPSGAARTVRFDRVDGM